MRFWDSSALVPLVVQEAHSAALQAVASADGAVVVWWGARVECASALARLRREGALAGSDETGALGLLDALLEAAGEVTPSERVREQAVRLVRVHPLRAADALQLAAALVWAEGSPPGRELVTLDDRLRDAAAREGFAVRGG